MHKIITAIAIALFAFIVWVIYLANTGQNSVFFEVVARIPHGDKFGHVLLFGTLTLFANLASRFRTLSLGGVTLFWGSGAVWLFVTLEEASQHFVETRTLDGLDYLADMLGIVLFTLLSVQLAKTDWFKRHN